MVAGDVSSLSGIENEVQLAINVACAIGKTVHTRANWRSMFSVFALGTFTPSAF